MDELLGVYTVEGIFKRKTWFGSLVYTVSCTTHQGAFAAHFEMGEGDERATFLDEMIKELEAGRGVTLQIGADT